MTSLEYDAFTIYTQTIMATFKNQTYSFIKASKDALTLAFSLEPKYTFLYYATAFVGGLVPVIYAFFFRMVIDSLVNGSALANTPSPILYLGLYFLFLYFSSSIFYGINQSYLDYLLRNRLQMGLMQKFLAKTASLDMVYLDNSDTQIHIAKVRESYQWKIPDFVRHWAYLFRNIIGIVSALIALSPLGILAPMLVLAFALPRSYFRVRHGNFVWSMFGSGAPKIRRFWYFQYLLSNPFSIVETRIFGSQKTLLEKLKETQEELYKINKKPIDNFLKVVLSMPLLECIAIFLLATFIFIPQFRLGIITIGTFSFIISNLGYLSDSVASASGILGDLYENSFHASAFMELLNYPKAVQEIKNPIIFKEIKAPKIEFRNVSFKYSNGPYVLNNLNFTINPKENWAVVGENGAGKTTIIKLLCRFYDVTEGEILINGNNIKNLQLENWYKHIGTLFQDFVRFNFTVRDNITLGDPGKKDSNLMKRAAELSGSDTFIKELPGGYDQILGKSFDDGIDLSTGQWQKLAIARAIYQNAPVLILDEPTSAIDAISEYEIFENLHKIYKDKTLILVSHRFSTVRNADKIIVLEKGKVSEEGSHEELMENNKMYYKMFTTQAKGYK